MASGEIVAFLNSDDTYEPEAIAKVVNFFQNNPKINGFMENVELLTRMILRLENQ